MLKKQSAFTLVEILVVIAILAILAVVTFVVINPVDRINQAKDGTRREEVQSILEALTLYSVDNAGAEATAGGAALPTVTTANVLANGADATDLDGVSPDYLTTIPTDPDGVEYKVGVSASASYLVGIALSDGSTFTAAE